MIIHYMHLKYWNKITFINIFAKYLISVVPTVDHSICAGVAVGIPYVEIGFVMDNMKNPAIFFSGQISFELD